MRRWMARVLCGAVLFAGAGPVLAEQYNVVATAGNDGDSHGGDNSDPDAFAEFQRMEGGGAEFYQASADASLGSVFAHASHVDPLPPLTISTSAGAGIEETIHFDELPADSVTIRAQLGADVSASRVVGFSNASARLDVGNCYVSKSMIGTTGELVENNTCPGAGGGSTLELVLTRDQIIDAAGQLDISVQVSASLEAFGGGLEASATVGAAGGLSRGGGPMPGVVRLSLDPPLAISFTGPNTQFPVLAPEPGAPLLLAAGGAALAAFRRRRAR